MKATAKENSPDCLGRSSYSPTQAVSPGLNIRRILVLIDFSPWSIKALQYSIPFASVFGARLYLLYVAEGYYPIAPLGPVDPASVEALARSDAAGHLAQLALGRIRGQVPVDVLTRQGFAPAEILGAARELHADLIIMPMCGHIGRRRVPIDSTMECVVRDARCPVIIVRQDEDEFLRYVCSNDQSDTNRSSNSEQAKDLAENGESPFWFMFLDFVRHRFRL